MDTAFAASLPLEVLHRVRQVGGRAIDPGIRERFVQQPAGRAHERLPCLVLLVSGLFSHEHHRPGLRALSEDGLGADLPQVAALAAGGRLSERGQSGLLREE
jgi:hypothetical protein